MTTTTLADVLIVEDDQSLLDFLLTSLTAHGFRCQAATGAEESFRKLERHVPDVVLLDLGLPDADGLEVVTRVRGWSDVPIIIISARGQDRDKVSALDLGADDYLTKPFSMSELLARIRVAIRHAKARREDVLHQPILVAGSLRIDLSRQQVHVDGAPVPLTATEWDVLACLARRPGQVVTHTQIMRQVWGVQSTDTSHSLRVFIRGLRKKLEPDPASPRYLLTDIGTGYRLMITPQ